MNVSTFLKYRKIIGQTYDYLMPPEGFRETTTKCWGKVDDVKYNEKEGKFYATLQRLHRYDNSPTGTIDKVPIERLIPNKPSTKSTVQKIRDVVDSTVLKKSENFRNIIRERDDRRIPWNKVSSTLKYGQEWYTATNLNERKIGDEVVWRGRFGKITWIGEKNLDDEAQMEIVAVVQFRQKTEDLPRHLYHYPHNRNIVNIEELQPFHLWLQTNGKSSSDENTLSTGHPQLNEADLSSKSDPEMDISQGKRKQSCGQK